MHVAALLSLALALAAALATPPARSETIGGNPGPEHNDACPHADGKPPLECYFDAVQHLYTMCRNVKSIEIIEFGYDKSTEGTNGAKSESCLDKQKQNIARPYKAALKEVGKSKQAVEGLHGLQDTWLSALTELQWHSGESGDDYKARVAKPYEDFVRRIDGIRTEHRGTGDQGSTQKNSEEGGQIEAAREAGEALNAPLPEDVSASTSDAELVAIFGEGGALARAVPGFRSGRSSSRWRRPSRGDRARAALWSPKRAPAPARPSRTSCRRCSAGGKVIVSTGTKTLQDQLFHRDLPLRPRARSARPVDVALLKGRANYVCLTTSRHGARRASSPSRDEARAPRSIARFAGHHDGRPGATAPTCPKTPASGRRPRRRARTASAPTARTTRTAS